MNKALVILLTAIVAVSACGGGCVQTSTPTAFDAQSDIYWPSQDWRTSPPEKQGMDADRLAQMLAFIDEQDHSDIHSILIIRNGYIVTEKYFPPYSQETPHVIYSCTKSFMSALVGIAIEDGYIQGVEKTVVDFFPDKQFQNLDAQKLEMTLEDLLTMRSGLDWKEGWTAYQELDSSPDAIGYVLDMEMAENPGTKFNYCSGCSHVLSGIIQESTSMNLLDYAQESLFEPLGITNVDWDTDRNGIPHGGWGLKLTPRDMAKFGYLYLQNGLWDGQQIVPEEWVHDSIELGKQVEPGLDYGYQWWVFQERNIYAAQGLAGQKIYVMPDYEMVVVFTADLQSTDNEWGLVENWIIPAILQ